MKVSAEIDGETKIFEDIEISPENKYLILRKISTSKETPKEEIVQFYESQLENDENKDLAKKCKLSCKAAIYDKEQKKEVFLEF